MRVVNVTFDIGLLVGVDGQVITKIFLPIVLYRSYLSISLTSLYYGQFTWSRFAKAIPTSMTRTLL